MKSLKILALLFMVVFAAACSKTAPVAEPTDQGQAAIDVAAQQISDGIIYFDFDKYDIKDEYREVLNQKAALMRQFPSIRVRIEGHTDERGTQEYNLALGERRAKAAYEFLVLLGVNPNQLEIISYGKERPVVEGSNEQAWSANRRDNFRVIAR